MSRTTRALAFGAACTLTAVLVACSDSGSAGPPPTALTTPATTAATSPSSSAGSTGSSSPAGSPSAPGSPSSTAPPAPTVADLTRLQQLKLDLVPVAGLQQPDAMAWRTGDDRLFVAERPGRVRAIGREGPEPTPLLDISDQTVAQGERGLLGLAFSPDGQFLYVDYTDRNGDSRIVEYGVAADGAVDAATRREVLFQPQPYANHNGGNVVFGPDGYLYIGFGDGGSAGDPDRRGQDLTTWLGKILRLDPRPAGGQPYRVPDDNPFVGRADAKPEIWSYGLRNPWRFTFDRTTDDLWIGDVGQNRVEEIDLAPAASGGGKGLNFGWSAFEGTDRYNNDQRAPGSVGPVFTYTHDGSPGGCSITGGYVYRGDTVADLRGAYVYADYCVPGIRAIPATAQPAGNVVLTPTPGAIVSFGEGPDGELYVITLDGQVLRIG